MIDPRDIPQLDAPKARAAMDRFRLEEVTRQGSETFAAAYRMLEGFFGPLGELEPAEELGKFVEDGRIDYGRGMEGHYKLIAAWDGAELAGVRDFYVDLDIPGRRCLIALSHSYVAPAHRRSGLAALFRALPASLGRAVVADRFAAPLPPIMVTAEMEPVDPDTPETVIRLLAYGRSGFRALDPRRLPYSQPDFRDLSALGFEHTALPLLGIVKLLDQPNATSAPADLAAAFPELFHVCHRFYLPASRVDPSERHALSTLRRDPGDVPLLPLPSGLDELHYLRPLLRAEVLKLYPKELRGAGSRAQARDPEEEWAKLVGAWRSG
jgi:hypothetical protein